MERQFSIGGKVNPLFLKHKMTGYRCPVKSGQVLAYFTECESDRRIARLDSDNFYQIQTVSVTRHKAEKSFNLELRKVSFNTESRKWQYEGNIFDAQFNGEELNSYFGILSSESHKSKLESNLIKTFIEDQFEKVGRSEDFDDTFDYDRIFKGIAGKLARSTPWSVPRDVLEDMIKDSLLKVVNEKTVKKYDEKKDPIKFFGGMFQLKMITAMKQWNSRRMKEIRKPRNEDDFPDSKQTDFLRNKYHQEEGPDQIVEYKVLLEGLKKHFERKPEKHLNSMLDMMLQGFKGKEMAEELKVSPSIVSRWVGRMKNYILEYAQTTRNGLLLNLMSEKLMKRRTAGEEDLLVQVFKEYDKVASEGTATHHEGREPAGEVSRVVKKSFDDVTDPEYLAKEALNNTTTRRQFKEKISEQMQELDMMDDVIEDDTGKLIGLRIVSEEIRSVGDKGDPS
jgi:DNA-directed RNA polymerase specialized sigma subunit